MMQKKKSQQFSLTKALHAWLNILKKDTWRNSSAKHVQKIFFAVPQKKKQVFRLEKKKNKKKNNFCIWQNNTPVTPVCESHLCGPSWKQSSQPCEF